MKNRKNGMGMFVMLLALGIAFTGCASAPVGADLLANDSQAVITVERAKSTYGAIAKWKILIDGAEAGRVANNSKTSILVDNGAHTIQLDWMGVTTDILDFTANSDTMTFYSGVNFKNGRSGPDLGRSPIVQERNYSIE